MMVRLSFIVLLYHLTIAAKSMIIIEYRFSSAIRISSYAAAGSIMLLCAWGARRFSFLWLVLSSCAPLSFIASVAFAALFYASKTMSKIAGGTERDLAFDLLGAERIGAVDLAGAEAMIDGVGGVADSCGAVFCGLVEG